MKIIFKLFILIIVLLSSSFLHADELDEIDNILLDVIKRNGLYNNAKLENRSMSTKSDKQSSHGNTYRASRSEEQYEYLPDSSRKEWQYFGPDYYRLRIFIPNRWRRIPTEKGLKVLNSDNTCQILILSGITYGETAEEICSKCMFDLQVENAKEGKHNDTKLFYTVSGFINSVQTKILVFVDKKVFTTILVSGDINKSKEILKTLSR